MIALNCKQLPLQTASLLDQLLQAGPDQVAVADMLFRAAARGHAAAFEKVTQDMAEVVQGLSTADAVELLKLLAQDIRLYPFVRGWLRHPALQHIGPETSAEILVCTATAAAVGDGVSGIGLMRSEACEMLSMLAGDLGHQAAYFGWFNGVYDRRHNVDMGQIVYFLASNLPSRHHIVTTVKLQVLKEAVTAGWGSTVEKLCGLWLYKEFAATDLFELLQLSIVSVASNSNLSVRALARFGCIQQLDSAAVLRMLHQAVNAETYCGSGVVRELCKLPGAAILRSKEGCTAMAGLVFAAAQNIYHVGLADLCGMEAATGLGCDVVLRCLLAAVGSPSRCQKEVAELCKLPSAAKISAAGIAELLTAATLSKGICGGCVELLCGLTSAAQVEPDVILLCLQAAIFRTAVQAEVVEALCRLAGAAEIAADAVYDLLVIAVDKQHNKVVDCLCSLPGATRIGAEKVRCLIDAAYRVVAASGSEAASEDIGLIRSLHQLGALPRSSSSVVRQEIEAVQQLMKDIAEFDW